MTHPAQRRAENLARLTEDVTESLRDELGREPTDAEIERAVDEAIDVARYDCPRGGDGEDD